MSRRSCLVTRTVWMISRPLRISSALAAFTVMLQLHCTAGNESTRNLLEARDALPNTTALSDTLIYPLRFEVLVTAPRMTIPLKESPAGTSIIGEEILKSMPRGIAMDEVTMLVPGMKVDNQANGERVHVSIRGQGILTETGIRSIKVLLDELPINDPSGFAPDLFDVDFNAVDRIEVLRGPATSFYGGGAAGGIINIVTQNSPKTPLFGEFSTTAGSNSFWSGVGQFGGDVNDVNYRVSMSRTGGAGYRTHTHFWRNQVYAKAIYTPSVKFQLTPVLSWSDTYHENPEGLSLAQYFQDPTLPNDDAVPYNEHMEMQRTNVGITGVWRLSDNHEVRFNGYAKHSTYTEANNHVFDHQVLTTPGASLQYTLTSGAPSSQFRNRCSAGMDLQWQTNDEHLNPNIFSHEGDVVLASQQIRQRGIGIFLIEQCEIANKWNVMGSVRLDKIRNELADLMKTDSSDNSGRADFSNVTARLGVTCSPTSNLTIYGAWGQGFIPPSTHELGTNPNGYGGFNTGLTAATSSSFEVGVRGTAARGCDYDVTCFSLRTTNDFDRYRMPNRGHGEEGTFYRNIGATKRYGLEVFAQYQPVTFFNVQLAYTYSHFKYDVSSPILILMDDPTVRKYIENGSWLPNSPQHQLAVCVKYKIIPELTVSLNSLTMSQSYIDGANLESEAASGYTLIGGQVTYGWHLGGVSGVLSVQARNLGNVKYVAFTEPDSGGNSYQPGPGREVFFGLRFDL
jgi:iron complex outermembrane receptor protein